MNRAETWAKNTWKKVLKREKIYDIQVEFPQLIEKLKAKMISDNIHASITDFGPEFTQKRY